jgi:hypothetical protein
VRGSEVVDVAGRVLDLLDLQRIDDDPEFLDLAVAAVQEGFVGGLGHVAPGFPDPRAASPAPLTVDLARARLHQAMGHAT